jgi:hypothetical protein
VTDSLLRRISPNHRSRSSLRIRYVNRPPSAYKYGYTMITAAEYRAWADESLKWAHEAATESEREACTKSAEVWLQSALRSERLSTEPDPTTEYREPRPRPQSPSPEPPEVGAIIIPIKLWLQWARKELSFRIILAEYSFCSGSAQGSVLCIERLAVC